MTKPIDRLLDAIAIARRQRSTTAAATALPALVRRRCLVTGATSGHGRAVAIGLARLGADVVIHGRDPRRCAVVQQQIVADTGRRPEALLCDLSSLAEIHRAADRLLDTGGPLHLLVNNAGVVNLRRMASADGHELTFAVNYLAHFALTLRLLGRLADSGTAAHPARIVTVSSDTHRIVSLDPEDLTRPRRYSLMAAYGRSKLALVHFSCLLADRLQRGGLPVTVNAIDPGPVESRIGMNHDGIAPRVLALVMKLWFPSAERAARPTLRLCADPALAGTSGAYFKLGQRRRPRLGARPDVGLRLWQRSVELTGVDYASSGQ